MTTVVAAFCPWLSDVPNAQGVTFVADCRLSTQLPSGEWKAVAGLRGKKLFKLSPYFMVGYSGSTRSARAAIARLEAELPKASTFPDNNATRVWIERKVEAGAREAEQTAKTAIERMACGPFILFAAYQDNAGHFRFHSICRPNTADNRFGFINSPSVTYPRMALMGSGMVAAADYIGALEALVDQLRPDRDFDTMPFMKMSGLLGLALVHVLNQLKAPASGDGLQAMSLTREGTMAWTIGSASPEFKDDPTLDPTWRLLGPKTFNA